MQDTYIKNYSPPKLSKEWKRFFVAIYNQRQYLIDSGLNQKPKSRMIHILDKLQPYINYSWTDKGAALFITKYKGEVRSLISERANISIARMDLFVTQAHFLINPSIQF